MADVKSNVPALSEVQKKALDLSIATNELNRAIQRAEAAFAALGLGVSAKVRLDPPESPQRSDDWYRALSFSKVDREWRLSQIYCRVGDLEPHSQTLLVNASREARVEAVARLPDLHAALLAESERQLAEVKKATAATEAFIASLKTGAP